MQRFPPLSLQTNNSVLIHAKLLFSQSIKIFLYNFQNLFWFSAPFFNETTINDYNIFLNLKWNTNYSFSLKFSSELYLTSVVLLFILILFHLDSPQLSDYPCLFILANEKITLESAGSQSGLSLKLFKFVYPSDFSLKRESSTI